MKIFIKANLLVYQGLLGALCVVHIGVWELRGIWNGCGGFVLDCALGWDGWGASEAVLEYQCVICVFLIGFSRVWLWLELCTFFKAFLVVSCPDVCWVGAFGMS